MDIQEVLDEEEEIEAGIEEEKLKKAEKKLRKLQNGEHVGSPVKEKIEETLHDIKKCAKNVADNVGMINKVNRLVHNWASFISADYTLQMFGDEREVIRRK